MRLLPRYLAIAILGLCPGGVLASGNSSEPVPHLQGALKPIAGISTSVAPPGGQLPTDYSGQVESQRVELPAAAWPERPWTGYCWAAPGVCYPPLYFEDAALERHGYSFGLLQPLASTTHFVGNVAILPYHLAAEPACECVYTLGHPRPGTPTPMRWYRPPLRVGGGMAEAGVATGLIFLLP